MAKGRGSSKGGGFKVGRDARNGQFITVREAERRPSTTTIEIIKPPHKPKGR